MHKIRIGKSNNYALVDEEDYEWLNILRGWRITTYGYAQLSKRPFYFLMHRLIMKGAGIPQPSNKHEIDHINGNGLDNRKENLRWVTPSQNQHNRRKTKNNTYSKYKGVSWDRQHKVWVAKISVNYKRIYLGGYKTEITTAKAYDQAAQKYFGKYAKLNFNS